MSVPNKDRETLSPTDSLGGESQPQCLNLFVRSIDLITRICVHGHVPLCSFVLPTDPFGRRDVLYIVAFLL